MYPRYPTEGHGSRVTYFFLHEPCSNAFCISKGSTVRGFRSINCNGDLRQAGYGRPCSYFGLKGKIETHHRMLFHSLSQIGWALHYASQAARCCDVNGRQKHECYI